MTETSGGEVLARMLQAEGVEKVFGIIDGTYFGFYSSLHKLGIEIVTPRHETCAAHMAGAYARLTGRLGVCMASNGPGVANLLPGLVVENAEGNRVLAITSCRRPQIVYPDRGGAYQAFDQVGAISHFAKWSHSVVSFDRVAELGRTALRHCYEGRPGVVHLDVPETIMNGKVKAEVATWQPHQYRRTDPIVPSPEQVERAADMLAAAEMPIIHAGSGVIHAGAYDELRRVAELLHAPVTTSWAGRGVLPETSELAVPMAFIKINHEVRNDADLVLVVGSRLGETDWWGKAPYWRHPSEQQMIQVDSDGHILGANKPAALAVLADAKLFLAALADRLAARHGQAEPRCAPPQDGEVSRGDPQRAGQARREARGHGGADEPRARRAGLPAGVPGRHRAGGRRRQYRGVGDDVPPDARAEHDPLDVQVRHARRGRGAGARRGRRATRPARLLHHRRRRDGLPSAGNRDGRAQRAAGRSTSCSATSSGAW